MVMLFSSARSGDGSNQCGGAGTHGERTAGSDIRTSGRTSSPSDDSAIASLPRRGKLTVACFRARHHQIIRAMWRGTLMRHVLLSGAIATGPRRMVHSTAAAGLVAPASRALGGVPRRLCTTLCAVNLAAIAVTADQHLSHAAHAQKQPAVVVAAGNSAHGRVRQ
jgi:hypothetical protein